MEWLGSTERNELKGLKHLIALCACYSEAIMVVDHEDERIAGDSIDLQRRSLVCFKPEIGVDLNSLRLGAYGRELRHSCPSVDHIHGQM